MTSIPSTERTTTDIDIEALRAGLVGRVVTPDDPDYEAMRIVGSGEVDAHPALIIRPASAADVALAVRAARDAGAEIAVRSGGHSGAGHSTVDGGVVIDVRDLDSIDIDVVGRTAWAGSGMTAAAYTAAVGQHGLATGFGDTGSVGIGGLTLGGGIGYLVRRFGLTIDSLLAAEIVTADGEIRVIDAETDPELFWALRGGGGNFGVVTRFRFRLHEVDQVVGGMLILPATPDTVAGFLAVAAAAPEELSTIANVMSCPPMPFVPEEHHGSLVILGMLCWSGEEAAAEAALAPFRALATPLVDMVRPIPYLEMFPPDDPSYRPTAVAHTAFLDSVDRERAAAILRFLEASDAPIRVAQLRALGGAMARVPADATAFAHRDRGVLASLAAFYDGEEDRLRKQAWLDDLVGAVATDRPGAYSNFMHDEGEARVREAYPGATWERLAAVKRRVDPGNLFHRNQNVPPA
jgi:FAD/FMN-containing dehydrogenase